MEETWRTTSEFISILLYAISRSIPHTEFIVKQSHITQRIKITAFCSYPHVRTYIFTETNLFLPTVILLAHLHAYND